MIEIGISAAALAFILFQSRSGWMQGLFRSYARLLFVILATMVALRFWHPYTMWLGERLTMPQAQLALAGFWFLFAVLFVPLSALLGSLNDDFVPVYPSALDRLGGLICGAASAWLLGAAVVLSALPMLPKYLPSYDTTNLLLPLDRVPLAVYAGLETNLAGVAVDSPGRTILPKVESKSGQPLQVDWK